MSSIFDAENNCAIVLAGGQGKRMKSDLPKPMFQVLDTPMLDWVTDACRDAGITDICIVTGFNHEIIDKHIEGKGFSSVYQPQRMGTGHAVMMALDWLNEHRDKNVLILNGDAPFIDKDTITGSLAAQLNNGNAVTVITAEIPDPSGYGRILRSENGIAGIVEEKDASPDQKKIHEVNSGAYWFSVDCLIYALGEIRPYNSQGEYYLTDSIYILISSGFRADAYISSNSDAVLGANDRKGLLLLNNSARFAIINRMMEDGVEFTCTDGVTIGKNVRIGAGTRIMQNVILRGSTVIGSGCVIGMGCVLENTIVGDNTTLNAVQAYDSTVGSNVRIGPFVQLRPGSVIKDGVKIGDFVEVKNSVIGEKTDVSHLTYVGDSDVGKGVNFGCGVVTVNYNGKDKFRTTIGDNAFIGCNTNLVAPVKIGDRAYTGAGSTITRDVPDGALAVERGDMKVVEHFGDKRLKDRIAKKRGADDTAEGQCGQDK